MPTPLQFLERVLPWPGPSGSGWGNAHWYFTKPDGKKKWRGEPFKTADELVTRAQSLATGTLDKAADVFFCLSAQSKTDTIKWKDREFVVASRHANTATAVKAIWADIDVKDPPKGYTSKQEAWDAVQQFLKDAALPPPSAVVWSGGGMHVYWISDRPLTVAEWAPYAQGLRTELERLGVRADYGVTTDVARVLRVPGTFNWKTGQARKVTVAALGADYDFAVDLKGLREIGEPHVPAAVTKSEPFDLSAFEGYDLSKVSPELAAKLNLLTDNLSDGIEQRNDLPLDPTKMIKACPHFEDAVRTGGRFHGQGLWNLTVLASTWLAAGRTFAHMFSNKYPTYSVEETDAMYDRKVEERERSKLGWPSCKSFENEGCTHCKTCPFQALAKSPLNLAERLQPPAPDLSTQVVTNPVTQAVLTSMDLLLPEGYVLNNGLICKRFIEKHAEDEQPPEPEYVPLFECDIISKPKVGAQRPPTLYFQYKHGDNYGDVSVKSTDLSSDQAAHTVLLSAGVYTNHAMDKYLRPFMRSWISKIDHAYKRMQTAPLGWVHEDGIRCGFAYGGTLYKSDGTTHDTGYANNDFFNMFMPCGRMDPFIEAMEVLTEQNHPHLEIIALQSWASPLVEFAGLKSTSALWAFSTLSGTHKSTAFRTGMALWAAPDKARDRGGVTVVGLENKMNLLRNLPAVVDELTDQEAISDIRMIFNRVQEGGQGTRGTRGGGIRDNRFWQLILACGSNCSMYEFQDRKGVQTDAKAIRIFELEVPKKPGHRNRTQVDQLIGSLEHNYGHMGRVYAQYLAINDHAIDNAYRQIADQVEVDLAIANDGGDQERFWKATVVLTLLAAKLANTVMRTVNPKDYFHYDEIKKVLYEAYQRNRAYVTKHVDPAGSEAHTDETWAELLRRWINNQLVTDIMGAGGPNPRPVEIKLQPPHDRGFPVLMHWVQNPPMVRVAYKPMLKTLKDMGLGTASADKLQEEFGGIVDRKTFLAGLPLNETKTRMKVWEVPIDPGHPLRGEWEGKFPLAATPVSAAMQAQDAASTAGAAV